MPKIGSCALETRDVVVKRRPVRYHLIRTDGMTEFGLGYDPLLDTGLVELEPGSLLISQEATRKKFRRAAGFLPGDRMTLQQSDCLGIVPSNFWQVGTFLLDDGRVVPFAGRYPNGAFNAIVRIGGRWEAVKLSFGADGEPTRASEKILRSADLGFSLPLILEDGRVVPLEKYAGDPRVIGDTRNFVDFGFGRSGLPAAFWLLLRRVMPASSEGLLAVLRGGEWVETRDGSDMTPEEFIRFQGIVEDQGLSGNLRLERRGDQIGFTIRGPAPIQRIPAVGVGFDKDHNLIVVVVEGRQPHSAGVSSEQLAQIMLDEGAVTAGLGAAGGDAGVWGMLDGEFQTFSSGIYRPAPCLLVMS